MNREEYIDLFHRAEVNLVAFKQVNDCDEELRKMVEMAVKAEREACAQLCEAAPEPDGADLAERIRARGYKQDGQCKYCTDGCPACDATKL